MILPSLDTLLTREHSLNKAIREVGIEDDYC